MRLAGKQPLAIVAVWQQHNMQSKGRIVEVAMDEAISYRRISSGKQRMGSGIARQTDLAEEYCTRHRLKLTDVYLDDAVSAYRGANGDRGALKALLDAA